MRIAIIGSGQLAMMLAQAGKKLDITFCFLAEHGENTTSVEGLGEIVYFDKNESAEDIYQKLGRPDVITIEKEQVDLDLLQSFEKFTRVYPSPRPVSYAQDRIQEKQFLSSQSIPLTNFYIANDLKQLQSIVNDLTPPVFIKHPRLGYDGKSQWKVEDAKEISHLPMPRETFPYVVEEKVDFLFEASIIAVRSRTGDVKIYPPTKNLHKNGILIYSSVMKEGDERYEIVTQAKDIVQHLLSTWNYVGVLSVELFITEDGIKVNELAPRVHNSGHWTMDGCEASQFENHIRAIAGLTLGETTCIKNVSMYNLLGTDEVPEILKELDHTVYWYNKSLRPNRKMGHVNIVATNSNEINDLIGQ